MNDFQPYYCVSWKYIDISGKIDMNNNIVNKFTPSKMEFINQRDIYLSDSMITDIYI